MRAIGRSELSAREAALQDEAEVVANRGEDCVGGVTIAAFGVAGAEMAVGLHVSDHGFDGGTASRHEVFASRPAV